MGVGTVSRSSQLIFFSMAELPMAGLPMDELLASLPLSGAMEYLSQHSLRVPNRTWTTIKNWLGNRI